MTLENHWKDLKSASSGFVLTYYQMIMQQSNKNDVLFSLTDNTKGLHFNFRPGWKILFKLLYNSICTREKLNDLGFSFKETDSSLLISCVK